MDAEPKQKRVSPLTLVLIIIIVLLAAAAAVLAVSRFGGEQPDTENLGDANTPLIGYEEGVTVVDDPDALQKAVDEAYEKAAEGGIPMEFDKDAHSEDGTNLSCYIANPANAKYDIYIQLFADSALSDELYLSGLIPPGKAKREIKLNHSLEGGNYEAFLVYTQVEDDHSTIHGQAIVTMDLYVEK